MSDSEPKLAIVTGLTWAELLRCLFVTIQSNSEIVYKLEFSNGPEFFLCSCALGANKP